VAGLVQSVKVIEAATLAEGVELWEEAAALQSIGVELIQGYLLHRPERAESIHESLATETSTIEKEQSESPIVGRVIPLKAS
jgi:EAL domain-containing protein (putative c-di-GMP-specific phosphodiesterase class I)